MYKPSHVLLGLTLLGAVLTACGTATPTPTGGEARTLGGPITAMSADRSSLTVQGQAVSLTGTAAQASTASGGASVWVNGRLSNAQALSVGQQVTVKAEGGHAREVNVALALRGPLEAIDSSAQTLTVAGQTVRVSAQTRIDLDHDEDTQDDRSHTGHTLADLTVGVFVEITGSAGTDGVLVASKIEVKSAAERHEEGDDDGANAAELRGVVAKYSVGAKTFLLGSLTVDVSAVTLPASFTDGLQVEVKGSLDVSVTPPVLRATRVSAENEIEHGTEREVKGAVSDLKLDAKTFVVAGLTVDFKAATLPAGVAVGTTVEVEGSLDATTPTLLHARTIKIEDGHKGGHD